MKQFMQGEMKPHKHAELIKAWADGQVEVEYRYLKDDGSLSLWKDLTQCVFHEWYEYRIKPEPKPDVVRYLLSCEKLSFYYQWSEFTSEQLDASGNSIRPQIKIIWNGETGELKSAEVIK